MGLKGLHPSSPKQVDDDHSIQVARSSDVGTGEGPRRVVFVDLIDLIELVVVGLMRYFGDLGQLLRGYCK